MWRVAVAAAAGALALAGCTGGSTGTDGTSGVTVSDASTRATGPTPSRSTAPTGSATGSPTTASTPPSASSSVTAVSLPTPTVTVEAGSAAAYAYVEALTSGSAQLDAVTCGQDGSVVGGPVRLAPGAVALTLVDFEGRGDRTVPGTGSLDAAGGTFHGGDATLAVTFTWTC